MLPTTAEAVRALLKSDPTLTPTDRQRIVNTIREHGRTPEKEEAAPVTSPPRILRRAGVADRLACSLRTIDHWTDCGFLHKVRFPGRVRSVGFRESDVNELIAKGAAMGRRDSRSNTEKGASKG